MTSGLSTLNEHRIPARGARIARRDDRGYREYLREEQRGEAGCPARKAVLDQRGQATSQRPSRTALAAALVVLNASVSFHNVWPTPAVSWSGALSIELALCVFALTVAHPRFGSPSRRTLRFFAATWMVLAVGHYASVTAPALWGRELNLYWDLRYLPDVAAMFASVMRHWLAVAALMALLLLVTLGYAAMHWAFQRVADAVSRPDERRVLQWTAAAVIVLFLAKAMGAGLPSVATFSHPVSGTYARQVGFLVDALRGSHALPPSPVFASDLASVNGADVLVMFVESYGAVTYSRPEFSAGLSRSRANLDRAVHTSGYDVVSAFIESPTFGGSSWLAHVTLLSGLEVRDPDTNARLLTERRATLPSLFAQHGYRTIAMMPGLWYPWPEGVFYGFADVYNGERLSYPGPSFGWWSLPDQYTLAKFDELERDSAPRAPVFAVFPTVTTHTPFSPVPPYQPDWPRVLTARPYDDADVDRAYAEEPDWMNLGPSYVKAVSYAYEALAGYLQQHCGEDLVLVVLGDHQPPALVSGEGASWDVPVHVISSRPGVRDRLLELGFVPGMTPASRPLGRMQDLTDFLLDAFGTPE